MVLHLAGLDIHRDTVVACCRVHHQGRRVALTKGTFATTTKCLRELADWLSEASVTTIAMEATGVYGKPVYYSLEGRFDEIWLCNAQYVKNVPGRKADRNDAEWLADCSSASVLIPATSMTWWWTRSAKRRRSSTPSASSPRSIIASVA